MEASETKKEDVQVNSFTFFRSYLEAMVDLSNGDKLKLFTAICEYGLNGVETQLNSTCKGLFCMAKPNLDSSRTSVKYGLKGGRPKKGAINPPLNPASGKPERGVKTDRIGEDRIGKDIYTDTPPLSGIQAALEADQAQAERAISGTDPVTMQEALGRAATIGMSPAEVQRWFDYWAMRAWIPNGASIPMDKGRALHSMKPWNERRHEFKNDEREMGRGDNYQAPSPADFTR
jgi:hypothetical protein